MSTVGPGGADWDEIYAGDGSDTESFDHQMLSNALGLPPGKALDLGCGAGGNAIGLAQRGWITTGVDSSHRAVRSARISAAEARVEATFLQTDMITWKPDGLYDLVVSLFALPPRGPDRDALMSLAKQALAPGGLIVVGEWETIDSYDGRYVTLSELTDALSDLEIIRAEAVDADPDMSRGEPISWPAVVVTARRHH